MRTLKFPIWNIHNAKFSQGGMELRKGHWYTQSLLKATENLLRAITLL